MAGKGRPGPDPLPREHNSTRGYQQHIDRGETPCPLCRLAESKARRLRYERQARRDAAAWKAARKAEHAARRAARNGGAR